MYVPQDSIWREILKTFLFLGELYKALLDLNANYDAIQQSGTVQVRRATCGTPIWQFPEIISKIKYSYIPPHSTYFLSPHK